MSKVKLISLYGVEPEFETRTPTDLEKINNKSFVIKFERLASANQFKHTWGKANFLLANIIKNINSKKKFNASKELALKNMFSVEAKLNNNPAPKMKTRPSLKPK